MEEKKPLKIKFKTAVIIILTAVVLLGIGANVYATKQGYDNIFFLIKYKITGEPKETITGKDNLLTDRDIETKQSIEKNTNVESMPFTEKEIKESFQKYLELVDSRVNSPEKFLENIGLKVENNNNLAKRDGYIKTTIKYSKFNETILNFITKKCFEDNIKKDDIFVEEDGYLCYLRDVGATGMDYKVRNIAQISNKSFTSLVIAVPSDEVEINYEFGIENYNGKCVIDYCHKTDSKIIEQNNSVDEIEAADTNKNNDTMIPFTEKEVKESIQKYFDLVGAKWLQPDILLTKLGLLKENDVGRLSNAKTEGYFKTNIKYSKFKEVMLNFVTEKCFEKEDILMLNDIRAYIDENGYLCVAAGGSSGGDYVVEKISKVNDKTYNAKVRHMFEEGYEEYNYEFGIENYNGKCVINYCNKTDSKI